MNEKLDENEISFIVSLLKGSVPEFRESTFLDIFADIHSMPEDVDSSKLLFRSRLGRFEDRCRIREYFKKAVPDWERDRA